MVAVKQWLVVFCIVIQLPIVLGICSNSDRQTFVRKTAIRDYVHVNTTNSLETELSTHLSTCGYILQGERSLSRCQKECMLSGDCLALYLSTSLECYTCHPGYSQELEPTDNDRVFVIVEKLRRFLSPGMCITL